MRRDEAERQNEEKETLTILRLASLSFLSLCFRNADALQRQSWRQNNNIYCQCLFIRTRRRARIQRCREMETLKNSGSKKRRKEKSLFSGRVAANGSSTDGLWRLCGRLKHYYSHSITFSSCCLLFRPKKCLMAQCYSYPGN